MPWCSMAPFCTHGEITRAGTLQTNKFQYSNNPVYISVDAPNSESVEIERIVLPVTRSFGVGKTIRVRHIDGGWNMVRKSLSKITLFVEQNQATKAILKTYTVLVKRDEEKRVLPLGTTADCLINRLGPRLSGVDGTRRMHRVKCAALK